MSRAICTVCGKEYSWHGSRGSRLKDNPSPCCNAPGKANRYSPVIPKVIKKCPDCGKAGLWWAKALRAGLRNGDSYVGEHVLGGNVPLHQRGGLYCPRCQKWIIPVKEVQKIETNIP
jgi:hypothetical protein